ncbi:MAG: Na(+)/H(+) antiporter subunit D [Alphaproteobacteria bacterium]|nr:Na(+)/H(+) antiporter subunit D [Alphaproteobacteria bacterium]
MSAELLLAPAGALLLGAGLLSVVDGRARQAVLLGAPIIALWLVWQADGSAAPLRYMDLLLTPVRADRLSRWFGTIFAFAAFAAGLFALGQKSRLELVASQAYAGAALGVVFAGDLVTLLVFWEAMAIASTLVIWSAGSQARAAGLRYLLVHLLGGTVLMVGIAGHFAATGQAAFDALGPEAPFRWVILAGVLLNAGAPPLSAWLPDAYPRASYSGMVVLSAFTTKTAVYVLLRAFPGEPLLVWIGLFMAFYGIVYAILENDMRRILAYSIVNQVGFMVAGIGIGTELALNGAASHAFAHILYKALLLMSAGSVLAMTGRSRCTELGGLFQSMPVTTTCGIVGALSISAFPLTSGFVTKSMISDAAAMEGLSLVWLLLAAGSAGVFLHAGIKFPWFVFFQKDSGLRPPDPPPPMRAAMVLVSLPCIGIGVLPEPFYAFLPYNAGFVPYSGGHVIGQLQLLLFSGLAFFLLLGLLKRTETITLDTDWVYRRLGPALAARLVPIVARTWSGTESTLTRLAGRGLNALAFSYRSGSLARTRESGTVALIAIAALTLYLIVGYLSAMR